MCSPASLQTDNDMNSNVHLTQCNWILSDLMIRSKKISSQCTRNGNVLFVYLTCDCVYRALFFDQLPLLVRSSFPFLSQGINKTSWKAVKHSPVLSLPFCVLQITISVRNCMEQESIKWQSTIHTQTPGKMISLARGLVCWSCENNRRGEVQCKWDDVHHSRRNRNDRTQFMTIWKMQAMATCFTFALVSHRLLMHGYCRYCPEYLYNARNLTWQLRNGKMK